MDKFEKLAKLEENLERRMGLSGDESGENYVSCNFTGKKIHAIKVTNGEDGNPVSEEYDDSWTLADWKKFRDRCLQSLR